IHAGATKHNYRYDTLMWTVGVGVGEGESGAVPRLAMGIPSPNPVTVSASIEYSTPASGMLELGIYDITGRLVEILASGEAPAGSHTAVWQPGQIANGVYFVRLTTPSGCVTRQVMVVR
ncbi:T9SS type A sorting domain-containing protein, partial [Candidatus Fermentibacteria bacterium]|nr:T9SS type A sorting domain-containing protein [Candidatus Fermentibacteria bacterium]